MNMKTLGDILDDMLFLMGYDVLVDTQGDSIKIYRDVGGYEKIVLEIARAGNSIRITSPKSTL